MAAVIETNERVTEVHIEGLVSPFSFLSWRGSEWARNAAAS